MKKLQSTIKNLFDQYKRYRFNNQWEAYKAILLSDVIANRRSTYNMILNNQLSTLYSEYLYNQNTKDHWLVKLVRKFTNPVPSFFETDGFMFKITKQTLDKLACWDIVGVQPMQGPVNMVYSMQHKSDINGRAGIEIVSQAVEAKPRKFSASYPVEAVQDLQSQHGIDIQGELLSVVSDELAFEINNELIQDLVHMADNTKIDLSNTEEQPTFVTDKINSMLANIMKVTNDIGQNTKRGCGNFVVVDIATATILQLWASKIPTTMLSFVDNNTNNKLDGFVHIGYIKGTIKLYTTLQLVTTNTNLLENIVLVGYKGGSGECDTGYIYSPYNILLKSGTFVDPISFQPAIRFVNRAGTTITGGDEKLGKNYYQTLTISGLV